MTGTSSFSSDLSQVVSRAVAIASLPLGQLNRQLTKLQSEASAASSLNDTFSSLQKALGNLDAGVISSTATVSDTNVVSVQTDAATLPGTYSINVLDSGSHTSAMSSSGQPVSDPANQSLSSTSSFTLMVGSNTFTLTPATQTLNSLAEAINASGAGLSATILNLGSPSAPDYRLSLQTESLGSSTVQLNDGHQDLLQTLVTGTPARYQVNGQPSTPIVSNSSRVTVAPGLTADLLQQGTTNVVVARTSSALTDALTSFVAAYNAAATGLAAQHGVTAGALSGNAVLSTLGQGLRNVSTYSSGSGAVTQLSSLGITLDKHGVLSLDQSVLANVLGEHPNEVAAFLGSSKTGGFLKVATDVLTGMEDPINGILPGLGASLKDTITSQNQAIVAEQSRIDQIQATLTARIAKADALIASLEQKSTFFTSLFDSMNNAKKNN